MKIKTVITRLLFLFVAVSLVYLIVGQIRPNEKSSPAATPSTAPAEKAPSQQLQKVIVYYFYGTTRCPTCRKFEAYSQEVLSSDFAEELADGRVVWKLINIDEPDNEHFVKDYQLYSKSIVLVKTHSGKQLEWKNLDKIWDKVRNKELFVEYIRDEIRSYLKPAPTGD